MNEEFLFSLAYPDLCLLERKGHASALLKIAKAYKNPSFHKAENSLLDIYYSLFGKSEEKSLIELLLFHLYFKRGYFSMALKYGARYLEAKPTDVTVLTMLSLAVVVLENEMSFKPPSFLLPFLDFLSGRLDKEGLLESNPYLYFLFRYLPFAKEDDLLFYRPEGLYGQAKLIYRTMDMLSSKKNMMSISHKLKGGLSLLEFLNKEEVRLLKKLEGQEVVMLNEEEDFLRLEKIEAIAVEDRWIKLKNGGFFFLSITNRKR